MRTRRVLLLGKRKRILKALSIALAREGIEAQSTHRTVEAEALFQAGNFDLIAFGRGVPPSERRQLETTFRAQNPSIRFVEGRAPIIPLLVDQIKGALTEKSDAEKVLTGVTYRVTRQAVELEIGVKAACTLEGVLYRLDVLFRTHRTPIPAGRFEKGLHTISLPRKAVGRFGRHFAVLKINGDEVFIQPLSPTG